MTSLRISRRWLFAVGFAIIMATTPAVATFVGAGLHTRVSTIADPITDCSTSQNGGSFSLNCAPDVTGEGWNPTNDWVGGLPSESGLTQQNDQRGH